MLFRLVFDGLGTLGFLSNLFLQSRQIGVEPGGAGQNRDQVRICAEYSSECGDQTLPSTVSNRHHARQQPGLKWRVARQDSNPPIWQRRDDGVDWFIEQGALRREDFDLELELVRHVETSTCRSC
jgi:hypothetical protein